MKALLVVLIGTSAAVFAQPGDPARSLFDSAIHDEEAGCYKRAMVRLETLTSTYPKSPLADQAKSEIDALNLFQDGLQRLRSGQNGTAFVTLRTLAQVYPESPLAKQADVVSRVADPDATAPVISLIQLRGLWPVSLEQIHERFAAWEVPLAVDRPYDESQLERARKALVQLLNDHGKGNLQVRGDTEFDLAGTVRIVFTAEPMTARGLSGYPVIGAVGRRAMALKRAFQTCGADTLSAASRLFSTLRPT